MTRVHLSDCGQKTKKDARISIEAKYGHYVCRQNTLNTALRYESGD